jgi:hypothetical protein
MISPSTQLGAGYAIVPVPLDANNIVHRTSGSNIVRAHAGNTVYRTPHAVARESEPGAGWPGDLTKMMFLPDGRLVPGTDATIDMFQGPVVMEAVGGRPVGGFADALKSLIPAAGMFAGGFAGYKMSADHKGWGAFTGAIAGGLLGLIFR